MGQRLLLAIGAAMLVAAVGLGIAGASTGNWPGSTPSIGMMGGRGPGGMMGGYGPGGMMSGYNATVPAGTQTISMDQAQQAVEQYIVGYGSSTLELDELIEFQNNFYAIVKEKGTGIGAFELLVDRVTGAVGREPGPDMMWNTKYGMVAGGMMGFARQPGSMTISSDRAGQIAQSWLDANRNGAKIEAPDTFYGYYTAHFTQDGKVAGMLSVNGYTGQVWFHTWHGNFVQERQVSS